MFISPGRPMSRFGQLESRLVESVGARRTGLLAMAAAMVSWTVIERTGGSILTSVPPLELVWLRYFVHLVFMLLVVSPGRPAALFRTKYPLRQVGRSLLMLGMPLCWILAAARLPMPDVMAIFWTTPVLAVIGASALLRERAAVSNVVLLGLGYLGAILVLHPGLPRGRLGILLAAGMSASFALYLTGTRWLRRESTQVNVFHSALGVFVVLTLVMPFVWRWPAPAAWSRVILIGVLGYVLLWCLDRAVNHATVAVVAPLAFLQPVIEAIWFDGAAGEHATRRGLFGILLVAGVVIVSLVRDRSDRHAVVECAR